VATVLVETWLPAGDVGAFPKNSCTYSVEEIGLGQSWDVISQRIPLGSTGVQDGLVLISQNFIKNSTGQQDRIALYILITRH
jgi:hypothetical protein